MRLRSFLIGVVGALVLLCAQTASAQVITAYTLRVYVAGAATPFMAPTTVLSTDVMCNQPRVAVTGLSVNPSKFRLNDPVNPNRDCIWTDAGSGPLFSLPFGAENYEGTLTANNSAGSSPESARSNLFTRPGAVPSAPQGFRVGS